MTKAPRSNAKKPEPARRRFNGLLVVLAVVVVLVVGFGAAQVYFGLNGVESAGAARIGGPFTLIDQDGRTVSDKDFRGKWMLVYFGFTFCPDICPTSLARNDDALAMLGDKGVKVVPVLISVDPERDTPERLKDYVKFFSPRLVGLTGSPQQIAEVAREYRVYYAKAGQKDDATYLIDHSALTYLIGPDGRFVQFFRAQASPQEIADRLNELL